MVCGALVGAQLALRAGGVLPPAEVGWSGQSVNAGVHHDLECARLQLEHHRLPQDVLLLRDGEGEEGALYLQALCVLHKLGLSLLPGGLPYFLLD